MSTLRKYATPAVTPAVGGLPPAPTFDGLPGPRPKWIGGFYPTDEYAPMRRFINGAGETEYFADNYRDYRLQERRLTQAPAINLEEITRAIELSLRGHYEPEAPYAYFHAWYNTEVAQIAPLPSAEIFDIPALNEWDSGAMTTDGVVDRGTFSFAADAGAFAAVGISTAGVDAGDPNSVRYGFLLRTGRPVAAIENGAILALSSTIYPGAGATFAVRHIDGVTDYFVNDVVRLRTVNAPAASPTRWLGMASLYGVNSVISDGAIQGLNGGATSLPALRSAHYGAVLVLPTVTMAGGWFPYAQARLPALAMSGGTTITGGAAVRLPLLALTNTQRAGAVGIMALPALRMETGRQGATLAFRRLHSLGGDRAYAMGATALAPLTMRSLSGRPARIGGLLSMPRVRAIAVGASGQGGGGAIRLPALIGRSAYYSSAAVALRRPSMFGFSEPGDTAFVSAAPFAGSTAAAEALLFVTMDSAGEWISVVAAYLTHDAAMTSAGAAGSTISSSALLYAIMNSAVLGVTQSPITADTGDGAGANTETWVLNMDSGATSIYESHQFNSYATFDGVAYGAKSDGLYRLEGDTDAGLPIRASMSFGKHNFSTDKLKRLEAAYIGASSAGKMYLKVRLSDGKEYTYVTRLNGSALAEQRIDVGRGMRATYFEFELFNSDGCDFELDTVEFVAVELSRRI